MGHYLSIYLSIRGHGWPQRPRLASEVKAGLTFEDPPPLIHKMWIKYMCFFLTPPLVTFFNPGLGLYQSSSVANLGLCQRPSVASLGLLSQPGPRRLASASKVCLGLGLAKLTLASGPHPPIFG